MLAEPQPRAGRLRSTVMAENVGVGPFIDDLQDLISEHWDQLRPRIEDADCEHERETIEGMGTTFPVGWVLVYVSKSLDGNKAASTYYVGAEGQDLYITNGIVRRAIKLIES